MPPAGGHPAADPSRPGRETVHPRVTAGAPLSAARIVRSEVGQRLTAAVGGPQRGISGGRSPEGSRVTAVIPVRVGGRGDPPPRRTHVIIR
jgi:hypothetical protein